MIVWVVEAGDDAYESSVMGVFSSEQEARAYVRTKDFGYVSVFAMTVGEPESWKYPNRRAGLPS